MQNAPIDTAVGAVAGTVAGIKSTEFWVTVGTVAALMTSKTAALHLSLTGENAILASIVSVAYLASRTWLKLRGKA